ncbi:hypothetical protein DY000_02033063 [Brassica cretica]|uniref:Uncharacterized protein n=1 Tax=Brassica cretica TaxID=69181 RepID=A0ABQ7DNV4_BRACR|nr:hypothetical protein DY000_02033063 [Brassica cretica]
MVLNREQGPTTSPYGEDRLNTGHLAHGRGRPTPRSPLPWARTTRTEVTSSMGQDDPHRGHLAHGRGRPAPTSPRPWARTTRTEVTSPMGEDDPHRGHLTHGRGPTSCPETFHPRLSSRNTILGPFDAIPMSHLALDYQRKTSGKVIKTWSSKRVPACRIKRLWLAWTPVALTIRGIGILSEKPTAEKINVKFPKIIMKGDEKWKTHLATNPAQEKFGVEGGGYRSISHATAHAQSGMTIDADKDKQTHDGTSVNANADRTPAGNVSTVTTNAVILDQMKEMFASA